MLDRERGRELIVKRVGRELKDGDVVNLGIGLPTKVANYIPEGVAVTLQSENGFIGIGPSPEAGKEDQHLINAGGQYVTVEPGSMFFDSALSFGIIRGGHVDVSVLGALQVDEKGNLANWMVPGKMVPGMGGAMDLVVGAKEVIIAMEHTAKGKPKILKECTLPLTAVECVDLIVTDMGVMKFINGKLTLTEIAPETTVEEIKAVTEAEFAVADNLKVMEL